MGAPALCAWPCAGFGTAWHKSIVFVDVFCLLQLGKYSTILLKQIQFFSGA
jgi:hypothetical protein